MSKAEDLILKYEIERQKISSLKAERAELVELCTVPDSHDDGRGGDWHFSGELCLSKLWEDDGRDSYHEAIEEFACEHCKKSFAIKRGPLAVARKEFGNIKRRLSYLGKKLIKESDCG